MAGNRLKAVFFCDQHGIVVQKAEPLTPTERKQVYVKEGGVCRLCGAGLKFFKLHASPLSKFSPAAVDHIVPRARGGQNSTNNLQLLCESCNAAKGSK